MKNILVLAKQSLGGIAVFWENVAREKDGVKVFRYAKGPATGFAEAEDIFYFNPFDSLTAIYRKLATCLEGEDFDVIVANEAFELAFLDWWAPTQPIGFIVHVNHQHSYEPALRFRHLIDHYWCVSETGSTYLRARGLHPAEAFQYSTFLPSKLDTPKQPKVIYVGRFDPDKNLHETADLLLHLRAHGYLIRMLGGGPLARELTLRLNPEELVVNPPRERVLQELSEAKFLCHNSYVEGLPIIHTEAMHFGCGIIANYSDKSIHAVTGDNLLLWHCPNELLSRLESFVFKPPPSPRRTNHPALNLEFLNRLRQMVRSNLTPRTRRPPPGWMDRGIPVPSSWIRRLRESRWQRRSRAV